MFYASNNVLSIAYDFIRGFADIINVIIDWLYTPIGIGDWAIRPIAALLPSGIVIFLGIIAIQIVRKVV